MAFNLYRTEAFEAQLRECLKRYSQSLASVNEEIDKLPGNPDQGNAYPGFGTVTVRKVRLPLKEYRLSKRDGLRLIYLVLPAKSLLAPIAIYRKGTFKKEELVIALVREQLRAILTEVSNNPQKNG
jgi:hypothetical protein